MNALHYMRIIARALDYAKDPDPKQRLDRRQKSAHMNRLARIFDAAYQMTLIQEKDSNPDHWKTINGAHVHVDENGNYDGGAGGLFNGKHHYGEGYKEKAEKDRQKALKNTLKAKWDKIKEEKERPKREAEAQRKATEAQKKAEEEYRNSEEYKQHQKEKAERDVAYMKEKREEHLRKIIKKRYKNQNQKLSAKKLEDLVHEEYTKWYPDEPTQEEIDDFFRWER